MSRRQNQNEYVRELREKNELAKGKINWAYGTNKAFTGLVLAGCIYGASQQPKIMDKFDDKAKEVEITALAIPPILAGMNRRRALRGIESVKAVSMPANSAAIYDVAGLAGAEFAVANIADKVHEVSTFGIESTGSKLVAAGIGFAVAAVHIVFDRHLKKSCTYDALSAPLYVPPQAPQING